MFTFRSLEQGSFMLLLLALSALLLWMVQDFLRAVFWAALLATLFHGLQLRVAQSMKGRHSAAAALVLTLIVVIVVIPLVALATMVTRQAASFFERADTSGLDPAAAVQWAQDELPGGRYLMEQIGFDADRLSESISASALAASQFVAARVIDLGQNAVLFAINLFVMLYVLFYFLRDGPLVVSALIRVLPLGDERERKLLRRFAEVSRATVKGNLVVAAVQGALGGITFWALGIPGALLWGVVMTILSMVPALGSFIVWIPAAVWLFATGEVTKAIILVVVGSLVIGLVDNFLRPILVSRDTQLPDYVVLVATLGGIAVFGISGFVIGPIVAALCLTAWGIFAEEQTGEPVAVENADGKAREQDPLRE